LLQTCIESYCIQQYEAYNTESNEKKQSEEK
jgi:hypothetical protein